MRKCFIIKMTLYAAIIFVIIDAFLVTFESKISMGFSRIALRADIKAATAAESTAKNSGMTMVTQSSRSPNPIPLFLVAYTNMVASPNPAKFPLHQAHGLGGGAHLEIFHAAFG